MQWLTLIVFGLTILAVITNVIDSTLAALIGVAVMCWLGIMTETDAFNYVDWNVMAILVGIWIIAGYFGKTGVPSWLSIQALKLSGGRPGLLVIILTFLAGFISMFVDNVVTILMMAPVALPLARALKLPGHAGDPDDRLRRELHGHGADHRRPAAADAAQRGRRRILRLHLASGGRRRFRS